MMRKYVASFLLIAAVNLSLPSVSFGQSEVPAIRGFSLGTEMIEILNQNYAGLRFGWWHEYFGMDLTWWGAAFELDSEGTKFLDESVGWFGIGVKGGAQIGRLKPFGRLGIDSYVEQDDLNDIDTSFVMLDLTAGMDFAITEHFNFGIMFLNWKEVLKGESESSSTFDIDGRSLSLLRGMHLSYQF